MVNNWINPIESIILPNCINEFLHLLYEGLSGGKMRSTIINYPIIGVPVMEAMISFNKINPTTVAETANKIRTNTGFTF